MKRLICLATASSLLILLVIKDVRGSGIYIALSSLLLLASWWEGYVNLLLTTASMSSLMYSKNKLIIDPQF